MQTLLIQYQIGNCLPSWYPLWSAPRLSKREIAEQLAAARNSNGAFKNILSHQVVDDGLSARQSAARDRATERAERNRCDQSYINDVRFGA